MYLGKKAYTKIDRMGRVFTSHKHLLRCDVCLLEYESSHGRAPQRKFHTCTPKCAADGRKTGAVLATSIAQTNIERYGAANVYASPEIKQRIRGVVLDRYGAPVITQTEHFKVKTKQTSLVRYGTESPTQSPAVKEKAKQTRIERFGVPYMMQLPRVQEAMSAGSMRRYGVLHNLQAPEVREKGRTVLLERYGSLCSLTDPSVRVKAEETMVKLYGAANYAQTVEFNERLADIVMKRQAACMLRYGVPNYAQSPQFLEGRDWEAEFLKRHETMKRNGSYGKSGPEDALYHLLCDTFGIDQIERQCLINGHRVDFYVSSIDTYIELDGVYWHGLDRPLHEIRASSGPRDIGILRTYESDRRQDAWFSARGMRLIRITDIEYRSSSAACLDRVMNLL